MNRHEERLIAVTDGLDSNPVDRIADLSAIPEGLTEDEQSFVRKMSLVEGAWEPTHVLPEDSMDITQPYDFCSKQVGETFVSNVVNRQVPGYSEMRQSNASLVKMLVIDIYESNVAAGEPDKPIVIFDSGCSSGASIFDLLSALSHHFGQAARPHPAIDRIHYVGIDNSPSMIDRANEVLSTFRDIFDKIGCHLNGNYEFLVADVMDTEHDYADLNADITLSVLMTMFIPESERYVYFDGLRAATRTDGFLILTEKTLAQTRAGNDLLSRLYHQDKFRNGVSLEAIRRKHLSLPRFLHPMRSDWTRQCMEQSGFVDRDLFWKHYMFESSISLAV